MQHLLSRTTRSTASRLGRGAPTSEREVATDTSSPLPDSSRCLSFIISCCLSRWISLKSFLRSLLR